jgi:hypothetical protein
MRKLISLSLSAGLLATSIGAAAASDVSVWRYTVSECLRAQQARDAQARLYHEASVFEVAPGLDQNSKPLAASDPLYSGDLKAVGDDQITGH